MIVKRLAGLLALLAAGLAIGDAEAATTPLVQSASLTLSSNSAGARPVALTLQLHYEMQCGYPGTGLLRVKLPAQARLPATLPAGSALLDGKGVNPTRAAGNELRVTLPPRKGVMCDVIGPGTLTLVVARTANIGNPVKPGTYAVSAWAGTRAFGTTMRITA